jgi:hypothetical protein
MKGQEFREVVTEDGVMVKVQFSHLVIAVRNEIAKDPGYRESWKANIAMAFKDEFSRELNGNPTVELDAEMVHLMANRAADYFLSNFLR